MGEVGLKLSLKEQEQRSSSLRKRHSGQGIPSGAKTRGPPRRAWAGSQLREVTHYKSSPWAERPHHQGTPHHQKGLVASMHSLISVVFFRHCHMPGPVLGNPCPPQHWRTARAAGLGSLRSSGFNSSFKLCGLGQVTSPLYTSVSPSAT